MSGHRARGTTAVESLRGPAAIVVDNDERGRRTVMRMIASLGWEVVGASSGAEGLVHIRRRRFDLSLIGLCLPDIPALDFVRCLRRDDAAVEFVVMGEAPSTATTVEAMWLGAGDVLVKPVTVERLAVALLRAGDRSRAPVTARWPSSGEPTSAAERWASLAWRACDAAGDLKTLTAWARFVGVSLTTLCETCRILHIHPGDARDFVRMLRATLRASRHECRVEALLDVGDRRTLRALLRRAGMSDGAVAGSVGDFLARQQFLDEHNEGVRVLRRISGHPPSPHVLPCRRARPPSRASHPASQ